jgi:hypothetical protein
VSKPIFASKLWPVAAALVAAGSVHAGTTQLLTALATLPKFAPNQFQSKECVAKYHPDLNAVTVAQLSQSDGSLKITVNNPTLCDVDVQMYPPADSAHTMTNKWGAHYELSVGFNIQQAPNATYVALLWGTDNGQYLNYVRSGFWKNSPQVLRTSHRYSGQTYTHDGVTDAATKLNPIVAILATPGETVLVFNAIQFTETYDAASASSLLLYGLPNPQLVAAPGKPVKLPVAFLATPALAQLAKGNSTIELLPFGQSTPSSRVTHAVRPSLGIYNDNPGTDHDGFVITAPAKPGLYTIRYKSAVPGLKSAPTVKVVSGGYELGTLLVDERGGAFVGQHFHRISQLTTGDYPGPIQHGYNLARSHNSSVPLPTIPEVALQFTYLANSSGLEVQMPYPGGSAFWTTDATSAGLNPARVTELQKWAERYKPTTTSTARHVMLTFNSTPKHLSDQYQDKPATQSTPAVIEPIKDGVYQWQLALPKLSTVEDRAAFSKVVKDSINALNGQVLAVQCWNEPEDAGVSLHKEETLGRLTETCALIHEATIAVDPSILTVCPSAMRPENLESILKAESPYRTTGLKRMVDFCDAISVQTYSTPGIKADGTAYAGSRMLDMVAGIKDVLQSKLGVTRTITLTEVGLTDGDNVGWQGARFSARKPGERGEIIYQTMADMRAMGVSIPVWYAYDEGLVDKLPVGFLGQIATVLPNAKYTFEPVVMSALSKATTDFGRTPGSAMPTLALTASYTSDLTQVASTDTTARVRFNLTVSNPTNFVAKGVSLSSMMSTDALLVESANHVSTLGQAGTSLCKLSLVGAQTSSKCSLPELAPGETATVQVVGKANPNAATVKALASGSGTSVSLITGVQWNNVAPLQSPAFKGVTATGPTVSVRKP